MCIHEPDHVFTDTDELANGRQTFGDVAGERGTDLGAFEVRACTLQGSLCIGEQMLCLVALGTRLVQQGPGGTVLGSELLGALELSLAIFELGPQPRNIRFRTRNFDADELWIDAGNDFTRFNVIADVGEPGQHAFEFAGDTRVVETDDSTRHVDGRSHLAQFGGRHFDAGRRHFKSAFLRPRRPGRQEQRKQTAAYSAVELSCCHPVALHRVLNPVPWQAAPRELGASAV